MTSVGNYFGTALTGSSVLMTTDDSEYYSLVSVPIFGNTYVANTIHVSGYVTSNVVPLVSNLYTIGTNDHRWQRVVANTIDVDTTTVSSMGITGSVTSNLIPSVTTTYDIGNSTHQWNSVTASSLTGSDLVITGNARFQGSVTVVDSNNVFTVNTQIMTSDQVVIDNIGTGAALDITQRGAESLVTIRDDGNVVATWFDGGSLALTDGHSGALNGITSSPSTALVYVDGTIETTGSLVLGSSYEIGTQTNTTYYRSPSRFSWHVGGIHSDAENDPGLGGSVGMTLDGTSTLVVTGNISAGGSVTAFASDQRLKTDIRPLANVMDIVRQIGGYTFTWRDDIDGLPMSGPDMGLLAQQFEGTSIEPYVLTHAPFDRTQDGRGSSSGEWYKTIRWETLHALWAAALKEQEARIAALEQRLLEM